MGFRIKPCIVENAYFALGAGVCWFDSSRPDLTGRRQMAKPPYETNTRIVVYQFSFEDFSQKGN